MPIIFFEEVVLLNTTASLPPIQLSLAIDDPQIQTYLKKFPEENWPQKAVEALKIGIIALDSASPSLDAKIVEEKFQAAERKINDCLEGFDRQIKFCLESHFGDSGKLPLKLDGLVGKNGTLATTIDRYFAEGSGELSKVFKNQVGENGTLSTTINGLVGPNSDFHKSLDPQNKGSIIAKLEDTVKKNLTESLNSLTKQFSLDEESSALSRLQKALSTEIDGLKKSNAEYLMEIKGKLEFSKGKAQEAERGTAKGAELEDNVYDYLETRHADEATITPIGSTLGNIKNCKKGDVLIQLDETIYGEKNTIVIEVKGNAGYTLSKAKNELSEAKENRSADIGIFAFEKGCEPRNMDDFAMTNNDFFITIDKVALEAGQNLPYLDAAYSIAKVVLLSLEREHTGAGFNKILFEAKIKNILKLVADTSALTTTAKTITTSAKDLEKSITAFSKNIQEEVAQLLVILNPPASQDESQTAVPAGLPASENDEEEE